MSNSENNEPKDPKTEAVESTDEVLEKEKSLENEFKDDFEGIDIENILPAADESQSESEITPQETQDCIVEDNTLLDLYDEILDNARRDRDSVDEILVNFIDMVINDGDSSSASKEAIVNLMKIKSDTSDKMTKVADLMTRIKLKERDTFPRYLAAQQNSKVVIESSKREMIKQISKLSEGKKK